jgi:hypothetical protein
MAINEINAVKTLNPKFDVASNLSVKTNSDVSEAGLATSLEQGYELDVLSQFKANLSQVEDLNMRLRFVLGEVSHLIKK